MTSPDRLLRRARGAGTQRERRPGVWEVRVPLGLDPITGRTRHRSLTVHGTSADAARARCRLVADRSHLPSTGSGPGAGAGSGVAPLPPGPVLTVAELLTAWLAADHPWKPSTVVGYRSTVKALQADPVARMRVMALSPRVVRDLVDRWARAGVTPSVAAARVRVLGSAVGWAWDEPVLDVHPVRFMRGPGRVPPRRPLRDDDVRALLATAELRVLEAHASHTPASSNSAAGRAG